VRKVDDSDPVQRPRHEVLLRTALPAPGYILVGLDKPCWAPWESAHLAGTVDLLGLRPDHSERLVWVSG
jgi:hypothetical protein